MKTMERKQQRKEHEQESQTEKELAKERKNDNKVQIIIQHLLDEVSSNKGEEEQRSSSFSPVGSLAVLLASSVVKLRLLTAGASACGTPVLNQGLVQLECR